MRALSALAATAAVGAAIWAARLILGRPAALWTGLVMAVSPLGVYYGQEARAYALLNLALLLAIGRVWVAVETDRPRDWAWAAAAMAAVLYTHYLAPLALGPVLLLPLVAGKPDRMKGAAAAAAGAALLFLPWLLVGASAGAARAGLAWIRNIWEQTPPALAIPRTLELFGFGAQAGLVPLWLKRFSAIDFPAPLRWTGLISLVVAAVLLLKGGPPARAERRGLLWLALLAGAPLVLLWTASLYRPLYAAGRFDQIAYPAFPMLVGAALERARERTPARLGLAALALGLALPTAVKLLLYATASPERQAAPTAAALAGALRPGDALVFTGVRALPVLYYLERLGCPWRDGILSLPRDGTGVHCRMFPRLTERTPAAVDPSRAEPSPDLVRTEVDDTLARMTAGGTVWVAFEAGQASGTRLRVPEVDARLVRELERRGWRRRPSPISETLLVVPFRTGPS